MDTQPQISREMLELLSEEELISLAKEFKRHERVIAHSKGDIYLDNATDAQITFHKATNRVRIFFGGNRCLAEGTLVGTPSGPKPIEEITPGDTVYSEFGKSIRVIRTFYNGVQPVADLTNRGRTIATCTGDHTWLTSTWRSALQEKPAKSFGRDTGVERRTFQTRMGGVREPHAYALGALVSNGCSRERGRGISISSPDARVPEKLGRILQASEVYKKHPNNYTWGVVNQVECHHYDAWIRGRYSHEKTVDLEILKTWDRESWVEFIAGVLDTDGSVYQTKGKLALAFFLQARPVIDALRYGCLALWQLDLDFHVDARDKYKNGPVYYLICRNITRFSPMLRELDEHLVTPSRKWKPEYSKIFGKRTRKQAVGAKWGANPRLARTYDLHVDSSTNLYCLANGLVTHNSGKTTGGANELRWRLKGDHPFQTVRVPIKACIVGQDFQTHAKDIIEPKIAEWFPPDFFTSTEKNQNNVIVKYRCKSGSVLDVKSHDQDLKVFEGSDYDFVWFDEPPPIAIFKAMWRGLTDRRGSAVITGTPITEPWLYDLYKKAKGAGNKGLYWAIFSSIHDNVMNLGEGNLEEGKARIKEFLDAIDDPDERRAREKGEFLHMGGLIFKKWDRGIHLIPPFAWPAKWPILVSADPHPRKDWAVSFLGLTGAGWRILLASGYVEGVVEDVAEYILRAKDDIELDGPGKPFIQSCWIDSYASVESMVKRQTTIIDELNSFVYPTIPRFRPAPKDVSQKIALFKSWLKVKESKYGPRPDFMVFDNEDNKDFIWEIEHYVWAKNRGLRKNTYKDVPVKENDDILDTILQLALVLDGKRKQDSKETKPKPIKYVRR